MYLANKKHNTATNAKDKTEDKVEAVKGLDNKAYEAEDQDKKNIQGLNKYPENKEDSVQSQIEMGLTESMMCNSKLQH